MYSTCLCVVMWTPGRIVIPVGIRNNDKDDKHYSELNNLNSRRAQVPPEATSAPLKVPVSQSENHRPCGFIRALTKTGKFPAIKSMCIK